MNSNVPASLLLWRACVCLSFGRSLGRCRCRSPPLLSGTVLWQQLACESVLACLVFCYALRSQYLDWQVLRWRSTYVSVYQHVCNAAEHQTLYVIFYGDLACSMHVHCSQRLQTTMTGGRCSLPRMRAAGGILRPRVPVLRRRHTSALHARQAKSKGQAATVAWPRCLSPHWICTASWHTRGMLHRQPQPCISRGIPLLPHAR